MPLDMTPTAFPATIALEALKAQYDAAGHYPSTEQWDAITDLLEHLESAARGHLANAVYVSAIPAGTGKSTSLQAFAGALCSTPSFGHVGMLIACHRVDEVEAMALALQPHRDRLCVIVGAKNVATLAMGDHSDADGAQIVITTQASLRLAFGTYRHLESVSKYHYLGRRRAVVCWDEALQFNRPVVISGDTVTGLVRLLRYQSGPAADALILWGASLVAAPPGVCQVPDFEAMGVDFRRLEEDASDSSELATQAKALKDLSGDEGWLLKDNSTQSVVVTHVREIPDGLMPVIVTDASAAKGIHRGAYNQMGTTKPVRFLKEAPKTYTNLTLRIVPTAASRSTYRDTKSTKGLELIEMTVRYIRRVSPERVLVVSYGKSMRMKGVAEATIAEAITARLTPQEAERVRHITWGRHTATNEHRDVAHVVLTGLNFTPSSAAYAASGAALNLTMKTANESDHPTHEQVEDMRRGMLRDSTFQAILRSNARKALDGDCGKTTVVIFQTAQTGLRMDEYAGMFPGVVILKDSTSLPQKPLKGNALKLAKIISGHREAGTMELRDPDLRAEMGMASKDFRKLINREDFEAWLASTGWIKARLKGTVKGLRVTS